MIEVGNKILEGVIRKGGDWEDGLRDSIRYVNSRTISYLNIAPYKILLGVPPSLDLLELWKPLVDSNSVRIYIISLSNPDKYIRLV